MKAAFQSRYGRPDVLQLTDLPVPMPGDRDVMIRLVRATVNRTDCGFMTGRPFIVRFWSGLLKPENPVTGNEFAGVVEAVGRSVTRYKTGDRVFGYDDRHFGSHAEFRRIHEDASMDIIPAGVSFDHAAAATEGAHYALCNLRAAGIRGGSRVLINGATGAIGSAAVQLARWHGCEVTAVCDTDYLETVKGLGAHQVIDYTRTDFTKCGDKFDLVFDAVGKSSFRKCMPLLKPQGIYISTELGFMYQNPFLALFTPWFGGRRLLFPIPVTRREDIQFLAQRLADGSFRPLIDRHYHLDALREAFTYVLSGQKRGNVIIDIG